MLTIGLLGGVASGKSTVARLLAELGAVVLDADRAAGEALTSDEARSALVERWGGSILAADGELDRKAIAARVFGPPEKTDADRRFLESVIHPRVRERLTAELEELAQRGAAVAVLDIPLLLEAGWAERCDRLLFVEAPDSDRRDRAAARGWNAEQLSWREAAQTPIPEKRRRADAIVSNAGSIEATRAEVRRFWREHVSTASGTN